MKIISENLHIISKATKEAVINRDETYIKNLLARQIQTNPDWIDLNIGPARSANFQGTMLWLTNIAKNMTDIPLSFDSTNAKEIEDALKTVTNSEDCIINSTSADEERLDIITDLAAAYGSSLIALTMNSELGIPKEADARLELAFSIIEKTEEKGIENEKILFDPLILPVCVEQSQAIEALNTLRMLKESFDPQVMTTIGLSNVSNGCPKELRPIINRVFAVMAMGCGIDSAIADSFDSELLRINRMIESETPEKESDVLLINIYNMMSDLTDLDDISYDKNDTLQNEIFKTAEILLNKKVYSHSYLEI